MDMRRFDFENENENGYIVIGTAREIRSLYKRMRNSWEIQLVSTFQNTPKFNNFKMYGILVDKQEGCYQVINNDMIVRYLVDLI